MNLNEILEIKFPGVDFARQVIIQDDGNGPYIKKWDKSLGEKPTKDQLDAWALEVAPIKEEQDIRQKRRDAYPAIGDQLDALYKAMESGILPKVENFHDKIKEVKERYPKKGEQ